MFLGVRTYIRLGTPPSPFLGFDCFKKHIKGSSLSLQLGPSDSLSRQNMQVRVSPSFGHVGLCYLEVISGLMLA